MATTFRFEVKKQPTNQGKYPIYIRITKDRKMKRIRTSVELNRLSDWNPDTKTRRYVRSSEREANKMNDALDREMAKVVDIYREDLNQSTDAIIKKVKGNTTSFIEYTKAHVEALEAKGATNAKHYQSFYNKLQGFLESTRRKDISFHDLSPILLAEFEAYLNKCVNTNYNNEHIRLNPNYIKAIMIKFRAIVNKAIKEGYMPINKYPFKNYTLPKGIAVDRQALDESEIQDIIELDLKEGSRMYDARNCFMFSFYCAGIRIGDLLQLRWSNITDEGTRLQYVMAKNQKQRNYLLIPQARQILSCYYNQNSKPTDYIFPFLDKTANYSKHQELSTMPLDMKKELYANITSKTTIINKELGKIAEKAGISKHISFHISRHSFASIAKGKNISSKVVQEALGHSKLTTTESYLHTFGNSEIDDAMGKVYGNTSKGKEEAILKALKGLNKEELNNILSQLNN